MIINNPRITLSKNIISIRKSKQISQEKLGELSGLHRTYIGGVERAERNISIDNICKISKALNTPIYILFKENS
ncbi:helix-turn-helix transcriptional regulator [Staphylococcus epidermidis]|nr:helix-turn-helix transcriptional regulator [Staphylococcus epidermidis]